MKKVLSLLAMLALIISMSISPVFAAGGKNQQGIGAEDAPGPGADAMGRQA